MIVELAQADAGEHLLRVVGEITILHPTVVTWVAAQHFGNRTTLVFTKVENFLSHFLTLGIGQFLPDDAAGKVNIIVCLREISKKIDVVL